MRGMRGMWGTRGARGMRLRGLLSRSLLRTPRTCFKGVFALPFLWYGFSLAFPSIRRMSGKAFLFWFAEGDFYDLHFHHAVADFGEEAEESADGRIFEVMVAEHIAAA